MSEDEFHSSSTAAEPHVTTLSSLHDSTSDSVEEKAVPAPQYDEKNDVDLKIQPQDEETNSEGDGDVKLSSNADIAVNVVDLDDDPSENPWTIRTIIIGFGLAIFGSVLAEIYYFKPQTIVINSVFLMIIAFVIGEAMAKGIPQHGNYPKFLNFCNSPKMRFLHYLNPHPFNRKEHMAALIMATSASASALGTEVLAVDRLWYGEKMNGGMAVFMLFSSQMLGYGMVGLLRKNLLYPTKMIYPNIMPMVTSIHTLHQDKTKAAKKLKVFYWSFAIMFLWTIVPEWMFTMLIGFSIPCLAAPNSFLVSRLFGGASGNEGLGLLSFCFDWNYIASTGNPMAIPLVATVNNVFGYLLCIVVFMGVYYGNIWKAQSFPFMSEELFAANGSIYDQSAVLVNGKVDPELVKINGLPYLTPTYVVYLIATNLSIAATFTHMYLYHWDTLKTAFDWMRPKNLKQTFTDPRIWRFWEKGEFDGRLNRDGSIPETCDDPHFRAYLKYKEVPGWWYFGLLLVSIMVGLIIVYKANTGLPWWAFLVACALAFVFSLFLGGLVGLFGFGGTQMQTIIQLIGGYLHPGYPVANMYFTLYGYNSVQQAFLMLPDLKQGLYVKLSPRSTFTAQMLGTIIGAVFNYIMVNQIVTNQFNTLLSPEGTSIWSGQNAQQYNSQAIAWGGFAHQLFSVGQRYEWVVLGVLVGFLCPLPFYFLHRFFPRWGFDHVNTPILVWYIGYLFVGVNSSITTYFIVAFASQWYFRKYKPELFAKYNYILAAGLTGGTQVMVFILSFAVAGASGQAHNFPTWWGNWMNVGNADRCAVTQ